MAAQPGGRARTVRVAGRTLDNGQHILIGAYQATLELMRHIGADVSTLLHRMPLTLQYPDGQGLRLGSGAPVPAFVRAVLGQTGWSWPQRLSLLTVAASWAARRFRCTEALSVAELCQRLPANVMAQLIEPLCVAALNTPASQASAQVFLRVLRDALFSGPGSSDLLLPGAPLGALLPQPAAAWLDTHGVRIHTHARVSRLHAGAGRLGARRKPSTPWSWPAVRPKPRGFARVRRRLGRPWRQRCARAHHHRVPALPGCTAGPADDGLHPDARRSDAVHLRPGHTGIWKTEVFAFVISGARAWLERGLDATAQATLAQAIPRLQPRHLAADTFAIARGCREARHFRLHAGSEASPRRFVAPGLWAAGDYVAGPYPATLEWRCAQGAPPRSI